MFGMKHSLVIQLLSKIIIMKNNLILICGLFLFICCNSQPVKRVQIIPNNFIGEVNIYYNHPNGKNIKYNEDGARVYEIDKEGNLFTKFLAIENQRVEDIYYYQDSIGNLERLYSVSDTLLTEHKFKKGDIVIRYEMQGTPFRKEDGQYITNYKYQVVIWE